MTYLPNNLTQLVGFIIMIIAALGGFIKFIQWYFDLQKDKHQTKAKADVELAKANVELAKNNSLRAEQVAGILENYTNVISELEQMKKDNKNKTQNILQTIDRIEEMVKEQMENFQNFININFRK